MPTVVSDVGRLACLVPAVVARPRPLAGLAALVVVVPGPDRVGPGHAVVNAAKPVRVVADAPGP